MWRPLRRAVLVDFLDSREEAVLVWTLVAFARAVIKVDGFLASVGGILRVLCGKLLLPFVEAVAALDPAHSPAQRFSSGVITTIGFGLLAYALVRVLHDLSGFLTRENAEGFLLAPALTLASFPILFVVVRRVRWDTAAVRRRWQAGIGSV